MFARAVELATVLGAAGETKECSSSQQHVWIKLPGGWNNGEQLWRAATQSNRVGAGSCGYLPHS